MKILLRVILSLFFSHTAYAQTLTEKILRESPKFSINMGLNFESNLQASSTVQNRQSTVMSLSPRYRINKNFTFIGFTGVSQSLTQENRSDFTNTGLSLSHTPITLFGLADLRPTLTLVLPTNELQREKDSLRGGLQLTANAFFRTGRFFILGLGSRFRINNHKYTISAIQGPNIKSFIAPFVTLGLSLGSFQWVTRSTHRTAWTYRDRIRRAFDFDQSLSFIANKKLSFNIGHNNRGSVLTQDGRNSNVKIFDQKTSVIYTGLFYNF